MTRNLVLLSLIASLAAGCSTTSSTSAPPPGGPAPGGPPGAPPPGAPPAAASVPAGSIGVTCRATVAGYHDYTTSVTAPTLDVCSVGGDGMLSLYVKGAGADRVWLSLAGYHGAGTYPLTGGSYFALASNGEKGTRNQSTQNCKFAACSAVVTDASPGAGPGQHQLEFAVSCPELCDADTHRCTTTPGAGGTVAWSFRAGCGVR